MPPAAASSSDLGWIGAAVLGLGLLAAHRFQVRRLTTAIAEQKRAELALRSAEEKYRSIFEHTMEGIFQSTPEGRFVTANPAYARMLGYGSAEEMLAAVKDIPAQVWADPAHRREMVQRLERDGAVQGFESELRRRDGSTFWVSSNVRVVRDQDGKASYFEGTSADISDRRRALELERSLRRSETLSAVGALVAGVAHEVRNPLFGISANLDAFEARLGRRPEFEQAFSLIRGEVDRLTALMQDLLDYAKPVQAAHHPDSIEGAVAEAASSCAPLAASRGVDVEHRVSSGLPPVPMDQPRLVQVFVNLLQNAVQHSRRGATVWVQARISEDGASALVEVHDSGPGFREEDLPRVFEPFFSRRRGGTGLGLAIVQRIVEEHAGTVTATNRPQGGAVLCVKLPTSAAAAPRQDDANGGAPPPEMKPAEPPGTTPSPRRLHSA